MHFTKARTKHNTACPLTLPTSLIHPSPFARVLGVILDKKLSWQPHLQHIKSKLATQTNVLSRLTASTWGATLRVSRLLYTAVVRPAITTGCPAWWAPPSTPFFQKGVGEELQKIESRCLRTVSWAYKATPVRSLQAEVGVAPLSLHIDGRQARFRLRSAKSWTDKVIGEGVVNVRQFLSCTRTRPRLPREPRNRQTASNPYPPTSTLSDPAPLAALQLSWAQQRCQETTQLVRRRAVESRVIVYVPTLGRFSQVTYQRRDGRGCLQNIPLTRLALCSQGGLVYAASTNWASMGA